MAAITVIGTGAIGSRFCGRLSDAGHDVWAFDRRPEALREAAARGASPCTSAAEGVRTSDFVITCVGDESDVEEVVLGGDGGVADAMRSGAILIETTSSKPSVTRRVGAALAARGVDMIDAPTSRGVSAAEQGTMSIIVGGEVEILERCRPILSALGTDIYHVGSLGAGHAVKALNMLALGTALAATGEAIEVAVRAGIDPKVAVDVLNVSSAGSYATDLHYPNFVLSGTYRSGFSLGLMAKDIRIGVEMAREAGIEPPVANRLLSLYRLVIARLGPESDNTLVTRYVSALSDDLEGRR